VHDGIHRCLEVTKSASDPKWKSEESSLYLEADIQRVTAGTSATANEQSIVRLFFPRSITLAIYR